MVDPISDLLIRIKNGYGSKAKAVSCPFSKTKLALVRLLEKEGFVGKVEEDKENRSVNVTLKYDNKKPSLTDVKRISKSGMRVYVKHNKIPKVYGGLGISILSTPKGILGDKEARAQKTGGELLCQVW